jgi:glycerol-3-phosphate acyltransferase PlsY
MTDAMTILLALLIGYGLGSVPFGLIFTRLAGKGDIRAIGSGNIGATNVLRSGSKLLALATLLADAAKGFLAVAIVWQWGNDQASFLAGLAALAGHIFPIWLNFKGGKGVAVFIGVLLMMSPLPGLLFLFVWLLVAVIFRFSSLAAIVAMLVAPLAVAFFNEYDTLPYLIVMVGLSLYAHRDNIARLRAGTEPKIGQG